MGSAKEGTAIRPRRCRLALPFALCEHDSVQIVIARDAGKVLARMQPAKAKDIREAIDRVAADPTAPNNNLRVLKGVPNGFRIRIGDWGVSYTLDRQAGVMSIFEIAPRGGAYR
jgi:mRNA interferase RelE/StbE